MTSVKSWFDDKQHLIYFMWGQALALLVTIGTLSWWIATFKAETEARDKEISAKLLVYENRGTPQLEEINNRLTATEKETEANKRFMEADRHTIDRIVDVMTRELGKKP